MKKELSRRKFLAGSATAAGAALSFHIVDSKVFGADAPSNKLNIAAIGVGNMGPGNIRGCATENIVAFCDCDTVNGRMLKRFPKARVYKDYRVMLDKEKDIDGVIVATPDHTHAVITMEAMRRGKHVYCQKPLTHTVDEARKIAAAAKKYKVVTQMGNQGHSTVQTRMLREWVEDGAIGEVREVHAWTDRPAGGQPCVDVRRLRPAPRTPRRCPRP